MQLFHNYLGFVAATCTTGAFVPQVIKVWVRREVAGISSAMYVILIIGLSLWCYYGIMLNAWPIIIANGLTLTLAASILLMKWYFQRNEIITEGT